MKAPELHPVTVDVSERDDFSSGRADSFAFGGLLAVVFWTACQLTGCAAAPPLAPELKPWGPRSASIIVPVDAPPCLAWSVREALDFLRPEVPVTVRLAAPHVPAEGEIVLAWEPPGGHALGLTASWGDAPDWDSSRHAMRAVVTVHECRARLLAHELGHAFGLANVSAPGRLMHHAFPDGGWLLSEDERRALAR